MVNSKHIISIWSNDCIHGNMYVCKLLTISNTEYKSDVTGVINERSSAMAPFSFVYVCVCVCVRVTYV